MSVVGKVADFCLRSRIFSLLTLGHLHALIHEVGHAVAHIVLTGGQATINLSTANCYGSTTLHGGKPLKSIGRTWVHLSGPLADIIFSVVLIVGIFALTHYIPMPQGLGLGLKIWIGASSAFWIAGEFLYAGISASKKDQGDLGKIASEGWPHLLISFTILLSICAVGAVGVALLL